jgi:hypothetical protein
VVTSSPVLLRALACCGLLCRVAEEYGLNVGRFIHDHPAWVITAGFEGYGYAARRREGGKRLAALTLDELAELIRQSEGTSV